MHIYYWHKNTFPLVLFCEMATENLQYHFHNILYTHIYDVKFISRNSKFERFWLSSVRWSYNLSRDRFT